MFKNPFRILGIVLLCVIFVAAGYFYVQPVSTQLSNINDEKTAVQAVYSAIYPTVVSDIYKNLNLEIGKVFFRGDKTKRLIALTFDDGPDRKNTPRILDILKKYNVKATFFVIGKQVQKFPDAAKRIVAEGHDVGNHTYNHVILSKKSKLMVMEEVYKADKEITRTMGVKTYLLRPPFGIVTPEVREAVYDLKYNIILWNSDADDWKVPPVTRIINYEINHADNGGIILLHSGEGQKLDATIKALPIVIDILRKKGYQFVTISEMLKGQEGK